MIVSEPLLKIVCPAQVDAKPDVGRSFSQRLKKMAVPIIEPTKVHVDRIMNSFFIFILSVALLLVEL